MSMSFRPMAGFQTFNIGSNGPEDILALNDGSLVTGNDTGQILRIEPDLETVGVIAHIGGRGLGLDLLADGRLVVCNAILGLQAVDMATGEVELLVGTIDGEPLKFCNNAAVAKDGTIYFSSSTTRHGIEGSTKDIVEGRKTGRLFRRNPDGSVDTVLADISFANGVALSPAEDFVLVNSTGEYGIHRVWLTGEKAGQHDMFATNLPGFPDNLSVGSDGLVWCALVTPVTPALKQIERLPGWLRFILAKLPEPKSTQPAQAAYCAAFDWDGTMVHGLEDTSSAFSFTTCAREHKGRVYLGSLHGSNIAYFEL